jgi:hypothetical protein
LLANNSLSLAKIEGISEHNSLLCHCFFPIKKKEVGIEHKKDYSPTGLKK